MSQPLVYVIALNYNGRRWIEPCFNSLLNTRYDNFLLVLVDNASDDGSVEIVRRKFPQTQIIENGGNLGFSEGNNVGIRLALGSGAEYIVLLNPDTRVTPEWLDELVAVGESEEDVGILGAVQMEYDGVELNSWTKTAAREFLGELEHPASARRWTPVEWVEGSCFAMKRRVIEEIGLLDPIYFAFYEEIDFCRRAACRGYKTVLVPRSRIHHQRGGSWEADCLIKRERDYRCDRSQFIYASTDPRSSVLGNLRHYLITLGTKLKGAANGSGSTSLLDLTRIQIDLLKASASIASKWRRDRAKLSWSAK